MDQQERFHQYVNEVLEWGKQMEERYAEREDTDIRTDIETLLAQLEQHEGEWTEEAISDIQMMVDALYEKAEQRESQQREQRVSIDDRAFQQYVNEVMEWGKQMEERYMEREDADIRTDIETLLDRLENHEEEWTESSISDIQTMVDALYEKAEQRESQQREQRVSIDDHAVQQYVNEVLEWGKQMGEQYIEREDADIRTDIETLLDQLENHEGEWTEEAISDIQTMVEALYERTERSEWRQHEQSEQRVPLGGHTLPALPYRYDALEPHISEEIMRLHHTKHHQSYVDGLNKAEKMMKKARETNDYELLKHWEREAAFHGSGHYLHTIFWNNMTPKGGGQPRGELLERIKADFGSFERFKRHFTEAAKSVEGVGWALLVWSPRSHRLEILQTEKHQLMTQWDTIPLLVLDVWEHAYYLQYKNDRAAYINNWWNVVNWRDVEQRFQEANKLRWKQS
jgi:superoxide dismutase, Fe-Mn family